MGNLSSKQSSSLTEKLLDTEVTKSDIYKISVEDLQSLFGMRYSKSQLEKSLQLLQDHSFAEGIISKLDSDQNTGIDGDIHDLQRRENRFGKNSKPLPQVTSFWSSFKETMKQPIFILLIVSAILSSLCEFFTVGFISGMGDGLAIIISTIGLILFTALADYQKDKQFIALQGEILEESCTAIRGKLGSTFTSSAWDLVVGDIILLETGSRVPADCIVLESAGLKVEDPENETSPEAMRKEPFNPQQDDGFDSDPFIYMNTLVIEGKCKALVCCVGNQSTRSKDANKLELDSHTPLGQKLENLGNQFMKWALISSAVVFFVLVIRMFIEVGAVSGDENLPGAGGTIFSKITKHFNTVVVLIVVSVPEGLPLTIQVSLAFSVFKMINQKILVRNLNAPEQMGSIEEICCGKTATLTCNKMKVTQFFVESRLIKNTRKDTLFNCNLNPETIRRIKESILFNTDARVEMSGNQYTPVGNGTEVGFLKLLQDADVPIHLLINLKLHVDDGFQILMRSAHTPEKKRSAIAIMCPTRPGTVTIYVKGAPEILVGSCNAMISSAQNGIENIDAQDILRKVDKMADKPLRVIGMAYTEMSVNDWQQQYMQNQQGEERAFEEKIADGELKLVWIGAFGLKDPLRPGVFKSIQYARDNSGLGVKLVSGDHKNTAKAVAIQSGILRPEHGDNGKFSIMTGQQFRKSLRQGETITTYDPLTNEPIKTRVDQYTFDDVLRELKVLARATPADKNMLITGLQDNLQRNVGCTGEGITDVDALQTANIGLAMGSGVSAARQNSDIILLDDNFEATVEAIKWGRNIFINVSRFLQFQVTVNISCVLVVLLGGIFIGESPLSAVQLLWVNLIMDTFAAIALATEPPLDSVTSGMPYRENNPVITKFVWRQIIGVSTWNVLVILAMLFGMVFDSNYVDAVPSSLEDVDNAYFANAQCKRQHLTKIYNVFVFLQLFNEINCRKVGNKDFQVFEAFFHNPWFTIVLFGTAAAHIAFQMYLPGIFNYEPMTRQEWGGCIVVGASNLLVGALLKLIKTKDLGKLDAATKRAVDEDKQENSGIAKTFTDANKPMDINMKLPDADQLREGVARGRASLANRNGAKKGEDNQELSDGNGDDSFEKA